MDLPPFIRSSHLRIRPTHVLETASDFSTDLSAGFLVTALVARDPWVLTGNILGVTIFFVIAVVLKAQRKKQP